MKLANKNNKIIINDNMDCPNCHHKRAFVRVDRRFTCCKCNHDWVNKK